MTNLTKREQQQMFLQDNWDMLSQDLRLCNKTILRQGALLWGKESAFLRAVRKRRTIKSANIQHTQEAIQQEIKMIAETLEQINEQEINNENIEDNNLNNKPQQKYTFNLDITQNILDSLNADIKYLQDVNNSKEQKDVELQRAKLVYQESIQRAFVLFNDLLDKQSGTITLKKEDSQQIMNTVNMLGDLYFRLKTIKYYDHIHFNTKQYEMISSKAEAMLNITKNANIAISTEGMTTQNLQEVKQIDNNVDLPPEIIELYQNTTN